MAEQSETNPVDPVQLDIFEHSRDVILRNAVIDALRARDSVAGARAITVLAAEFANDPFLETFNILLERLNFPVPAPLDPVSAKELVRVTECSVPAAHKVFGETARAWLAPFWVELAAAIAHLSFDPREETLHAVALLLRAGNWAQADARIDTIPSWRRLPAPLAWKVESACRTSGLEAAWPYLAELSWMAPQRAAALAAKLADAELNKLLRLFDAQFEGEGEAADFAWFPAWALIADPRWVACLRLAQAGADTAAERCARQVLGVLSLERQGRHADLIDARRRLRDIHRGLFELYMQRR